MPSDPNWLYTTIAQSSAAIVAIIGGFITHTVLSLSAEKRSLINQRKDKEARLRTLREEKARLSRELDAKEVAIFIESVTDKILVSEHIPTLEEVISDNREAESLNPAILKREYKMFADKVVKARNFIREHVQKIGTDSIAFSDWVKMNQFDISEYDYEILERLYDIVLDMVLEHKQESLGFWQQLASSPRLSGITFPHITPISEQQELQTLRERIQQYGVETAMLENDANGLESRISTFSYPPNLGWGVVPLIFLAVFCILLPALIIGNEAFFRWTKLLTLITFGLGLTGVLTYIIFLIRTLKKRY